jgi:hypothetical protein
MGVNLTISKILNPPTQVSDVLAGDPGNSGLDLGQVVNNEYTPIINKTANTGYQDVYVSHDATVDEITDVKTFIAEFSQVYGGADSAANDLATIIAKGQNDSEATANNSDGLSGGFRIEHGGIDISGLGASAFLPSRAQVNIYGNNGTDGISLASAFDLHVDACVWNNAGSETDATTPETGKIGVSGDTVLGDTAHVGVRFYLEDAAPDGGIIQWDWVWGYSFTA